MKLYEALTSGGTAWMQAVLEGDDPRATFGELVMVALSYADDPPLHLDLYEDQREHFASIRFDYPGVWEIVEPSTPYRRQSGNSIDPDAYGPSDPKSVQYRRS